MNHIIPIINVRTIFGHTPTLGNFWTEACPTSRTSDGLGRMFFFLKLTSLVAAHFPGVKAACAVRARGTQRHRTCGPAAYAAPRQFGYRSAAQCTLHSAQYTVHRPCSCTERTEQVFVPQVPTAGPALWSACRDGVQIAPATVGQGSIWRTPRASSDVPHQVQA